VIYVDRRQSLLLTTGAVFAGVNAAFGQTPSKLLDSIAGAFALQKFAIDASDKDFPRFVTQDFYSRQSTVYEAINSKLFDNANSAKLYLRSIIGSSNPGIPAEFFSENAISSQIQAVDFVVSANLPLVPAVADIQPIGIPTIEPLEKRTDDTDLGVALDIALQTLGIFEGKTLVDELLKDDDISKQLHQLVSRLKEKEWTKLLELAEKVFQVALASSAVKAYAEKVGRRIAFKLTLRCIPVAGWAYLGASFLIALKANYRRFSFA